MTTGRPTESARPEAGGVTPPAPPRSVLVAGEGHRHAIILEALQSRADLLVEDDALHCQDAAQEATLVVVPDTGRTESVAALREAFEETGLQARGRLVLVSGLEAAGPREPGTGMLFEDVAPQPTTDLGRALLALEDAARSWCTRCGAVCVILRPGHVYGRGEAGFAADLLERLEQEDSSWFRTNSRDALFLPLHANDLVEAVQLALERGEGVLHLTDGSSPTLREVLRLLTRAAAVRRFPLRKVRTGWFGRPSGAAVHWPYVNHLALRTLGFAPRVSLQRGLERLLLEIRAQATGNTGNRGDLSRMAAFEERKGEDSDIFAEEGRFWDEEHAHEELFFQDPHDWHFDVGLGKTLHAPVYGFVRKQFRRRRIRSVLELGCGTGPYALSMAEEKGVRVHAIDLAAAKIESGRRIAKERGLEHLVDFQVANALTYTVPEKVDAICGFGTLHHLPDLEETLPGIIERNLKPGGIILAHEPHQEHGYAPFLTRFMQRIARSRWARHFDEERYTEHTQSVARGGTLREESPAGVQFHREEFHLDEYLCSLGPVLGSRYLNMLAPFVANMFVIYMRVIAVRRLVRLLLPLVVRIDLLMCRFPRWRKWASEVMIAVEPRRNAADG